MRNSQNKKQLQIILILLVAVLTLGIGYATISNINLIIDGNATANPNDNNFKVHFVETADTPNLTGNVTLTGSAQISNEDNKVATFNAGGLTKVGDYAIATYTILNDSEGIGAELSLDLTISNTEYFKVTETVTDSQLQAGDTTTGTVKIEMIKTPINNDVSTSVTARLMATPLENASATGNKSTSKSIPKPFTSDSWTTIKTNVQNGNTDQYDIGDTKTVQINNTNYTVRLANKSSRDQCDNEDYSQTACGFVVEFIDIVEQRRMNSTNTNIGSWPASELRAYLQSEFLNKLPEDLQSAIISTRVISGYGCLDWNMSTFTCNSPDNNGNLFVSTDKVFLPSFIEINSYDNYGTTSGTTTTFDYYKDKSSSNTSKNQKRYAGQNSSWWTRNAYVFYSNTFRYIRADGYDDSLAANSNSGVAPAFRIG